MSRHILDHPREGDGRTAEFTKIERREGLAGPHKATQDLQRRATEVTAPDDLRTAAFLKIERGNSA